MNLQRIVAQTKLSMVPAVSTAVNDEELRFVQRLRVTLRQTLHCYHSGRSGTRADMAVLFARILIYAHLVLAEPAF